MWRTFRSTTATLGFVLSAALWTGLASVESLHASGPETGPSSPPPSSAPNQPGDRPLTAAEREAQARADAEAEYGKGLKDLEKAHRELAEAEELAVAGPAAEEKARKKAESANKRFRKAAERFREATVLWPAHAESWNLLGYCLRRQGRLEEAFDAYWRCLEIDPQHAGAHEYLGEAWLQSDRPEEAEKELAWLKGRQAKEAAQLAASLAAYRAANPKPAAADTASTTSATGATGAGENP